MPIFSRGLDVKPSRIRLSWVTRCGVLHVVDVETSLPVESGREEVVQGCRTGGAPQQYMFRCAVSAAAALIWGVSGVGVGSGGARLQSEYS